MRAAVIGTPISHSKSPRIFAALGFRYDAVEVSAGDLAAYVDRLRADRSRVGVNVTLPHKETIVPHLDRVSPEARAIGAVNLVRRDGDALVGENTDVAGIRRSLTEAGFDVRGRSVLILGAGGAARAAAYAAAEAGAAAVTIANRSIPRARALRDAFADLFPATRFLVPGADVAAGIATRFGLVVQATSVGMRGGPAGELPGFAEARPDRAGAVALDVVYVPERTEFLAEAEARGFRALGGLEMLIGQALAGFETWTGSAAPEGIAPRLRARLRGPVFLAGPMGSGKSSVGPRLAARLGFDFLDLDRRIEARTGASVAEIFRARGEAAFRREEDAALAETLDESAAGGTPRVIALGGGTLATEGNLDRILATGTLVCLDCRIDELARRLAGEADRRPLLAGREADGIAGALATLGARREAGYARADFRVDTTAATPEAVARAIAEKLGEIR